MNEKENQQLAEPGLFSLLKPYKFFIVLLLIFTIISNVFNLVVPKIIGGAIDTYTKGNFILNNLIIEFSIIAILIFIFTYLQNIMQVYISEKVARDLRNDLVNKISVQEYSYIEKVTPAKLLTNLTSDVDAIKSFVGTAITAVISSIFLIIGASVLLILINWKLALAVLAIIPIIAGTFFYIFARVRKLFLQSQKAIDWLNKVISESILGSAFIRLLNSREIEYEKFTAASTEAKKISLNILALFASLIPIITFCTNLATLVIIVLGGHFVIMGAMTLGNFTAFNSYLAILIFPILIIGFMTNVIAGARASYGRITEVLYAPKEKKNGLVKANIRGDIEVKDVVVMFGEKFALQNISFKVSSGSRTAIIGPTAAGKTQLLYLLTGLLTPTQGEIYIDGKNINEYDKENLHSQIGFVFQDSILFNLTLRENIAFSNMSNVAETVNLEKAINTAELRDFIDTLPDKLDTIVSERGASLSGGQKQRIMLARALTLNPKILLLDDFTSRVDKKTETKILSNIKENYPNLTLISVTQKIQSIEHYDQIILLMEGEILAKGKHQELLDSSPEYVQIYESQKSMNQYE